MTRGCSLDKGYKRFTRYFTYEIQQIHTIPTNVSLYQSERKAKVWRENGSKKKDHDPKHTSSSDKHSKVSFTPWTCVAVSGIG